MYRMEHQWKHSLEMASAGEGRYRTCFVSGCRSFSFYYRRIMGEFKLVGVPPYRMCTGTKHQCNSTAGPTCTSIDPSWRRVLAWDDLVRVHLWRPCTCLGRSRARALCGVRACVRVCVEGGGGILWLWK
jgi:hypothetical protein